MLSSIQFICLISKSLCCVDARYVPRSSKESYWMKDRSNKLDDCPSFFGISTKDLIVLVGNIAIRKLSVALTSIKYHIFVFAVLPLR